MHMNRKGKKIGNKTKSRTRDFTYCVGPGPQVHVVPEKLKWKLGFCNWIC
jgi:hypothetical protein